MSGWDEGSVFVSGGGGLAGGKTINNQNDGKASLDIKERFGKFIRDWKNDKNVFIYRDQLKQNYNLGLHYLEVNIDHLIRYDSDLSNLLLNKPNEIIPIFEDSIKDSIKLMNFDLGSIDDIQLLFRSSLEPSAIRDMKSINIAKLVKIQGIVISASRTQPKPQKMILRCKNCEHQLIISIKPGINQSMVPQQCQIGKNYQSKACPNNPYLVLSDQCTFVNQQVLKLQEAPETIPTGEMPRHILLSLDRCLAERVTPGQRIMVLGVYGIFEAARGRGGGGGQSSTIRTPYLRVLGITSDTNGRRDYLSFTPKEEEEFRKLSRRPDLYQLLSKSIAPAIFGHEDIKRAICCQLFGGSPKRLPDKMRLRGDINILLIGDPGTAKSQMLKFVEKVSPIAVYTSGKGSSAAGLTASVIREPSTGEFYLEGGAMVVADGGIVCIDEFDKMDLNDRVAIHEAMEQQTISIAKAGITTILNSRTSVLAASNPVYGRYDDQRSAGENIDFQSTILSRFDMIFVVRDPRNEASDKKIAGHVLGIHMRTNSGHTSKSTDGKSEDMDINFLKKYISFCKSRESPRLSPEALETLKNHYVSVRSTVREKSNQEPNSNVIPITVRQLEAIIRISEALAKMHLSPVATNQHAQEAIRLFNVSTFDAITTNNAVGESMTLQMMQEILQGENMIKKIIAIGQKKSVRQLKFDLASKSISSMAMNRAIDILVKKDEFEYLFQRKLIQRKR
ncbi:MCM family protein [Tieghemostelium lacteum]|uniref:DNA replication licensing factor MCM5 n=1 Tax=Tieghemostelium lacteum TaxID=361077 RepID=A0A152A2N3_TIELA|nr:MCM family protein [Tieghemostelium lacteum]|eukprot:KYR00513.1 MCM family protein [Tieghemostelium lacteum]